MRKRFEQQLSLGYLPISEFIINTKSRHQLPPLLVGLKYIFNEPELNEEIFEILESKITPNKDEENKDKKKTNVGRPGMSLWEIFVLGVVRLNLDIDYDHLHDMANNHFDLRGILGKACICTIDKRYNYELQTIKDNVSLLDSNTIDQINELVVKASHEKIKKN